MARELSEAAKVAKLCRAFLKEESIPGRVTSTRYSMGSCVTVTLEDQKNEVLEKLRSEFAKYKYGSFDGMDDSYNMDNVREDIPQVSHLHVNNSYSYKMSQRAYAYIRNNYKGAEHLAENYNDCVDYNERVQGEYIGTLIHQLIAGASVWSDDFWESLVD